MVSPRAPKWEVVGGPTDHDIDWRVSRDIQLQSPDFPHWTVTVDVALGVGVVRLEIAPRDLSSAPTHPVGARALCRQLALTELGRVARQRAAADLEATQQTLERSGVHASPALAKSFERWGDHLNRPGRKSDGSLATLVHAYLTHLDLGLSTADAAREVGYGKDRLRDLLRIAAARGLYESAGQGKAGGRLTDRGEQARIEWEGDD